MKKNKIVRIPTITTKKKVSPTIMKCTPQQTATTSPNHESSSINFQLQQCLSLAYSIFDYKTNFKGAFRQDNHSGF